MGDYPHRQPTIAIIIVQFVTDVYFVNKLSSPLSSFKINDVIFISSTRKDNGNASEDSRPDCVLALSLAYDTKHSTLIVSVDAVRHLHTLTNSADSDPQSIASPYVRLQLLLQDGRRLKAKTRVLRTTADQESAQFGETFAFRGLSAGLRGTRLHAAVLGFDRFSRDSVLGEVTLSLDDNRVLPTLVRRGGVLETYQLNVEPKLTAESPQTKVILSYTSSSLSSSS